MYICIYYAYQFLSERNYKTENNYLNYISEVRLQVKQTCTLSPVYLRWSLIMVNQLVSLDEQNAARIIVCRTHKTTLWCI